MQKVFKNENKAKRVRRQLGMWNNLVGKKGESKNEKITLEVLVDKRLPFGKGDVLKDFRVGVDEVAVSSLAGPMVSALVVVPKN